MKKIVPVILILLLFCAGLKGSPARRGVFLIRQPDGTTFRARLAGDEFCRILTTADGCAVRKDPDGVYRYAYYREDGSTQSSGYAVGQYTPSLIRAESGNIPYEKLFALATRKRSAGIARNFRNRIPTRSGETSVRNCVFILAQFPDLQFRNPSTMKTDLEELVNQKGYSRNGATGSVLDYLNDQFRGLCEFRFTVTEIVTLSRDHAYYGDNNEDGQDGRAVDLVKEACTLVDPAVDFARLDGDGDGKVDNVFVIVAGKSEAEGGGTDCFWPHQWHIQENFVRDGKQISGYSLSTELSVQGQNSNGQLVWGLTRIGTICHEYSHTLGLADAYDTDGKGSGGKSDALWFQTALMDGGCYNNQGRTPPNYNAMDRELVGIGCPDTLKIGSCTLEPIDLNGRYLIYENPQNRFDSYLIECRRLNGWDAYIGGSGLLIYHMDMSNQPAGWSDAAGKEVSALYRWIHNEVNCNPEHQCADLIETSPSAMEVSQVFYPYRTKTSFTTHTAPSFRFKDGTESALSIANIQRHGENITFQVYNSGQVIPSVTDLHGEVYQDAVILTWKSADSGYAEKATVTWGETSKSKTRMEVTPYEPGKYSLTLEGLSPTTPYSVSVLFGTDAVQGEPIEYDFLTKAHQAGKPAFIYLEYLRGVRSGGKFPAGTGLPLRVFNAVGEHVDWFFNGSAVRTDGSGYYPLLQSGTLKAVVTHADGGKDVLVKELTVE